MGCKGVFITRTCFRDEFQFLLLPLLSLFFLLSIFYYIFFKITLQVNNVKRIQTMTCERRRHDVQKSRWRRDRIGQVIGMNSVN